jgi:hypothetical protein
VYCSTWPACLVNSMTHELGQDRESLYKALSSSSFSTASYCGWRPAAESAVSPGTPGETV